MNKLNELIGCMTTREKAGFSDYLSSPYVKASEPVMRCFAKALKQIESGNQPDKKELFKRIYPAKRFNDKAYRYLQSELSKHIQNFLVIRHLESNPMSFNSLLLKTLSHRNCIKSAKYIQGIIRSEPATSPEHFRIVSESAEEVMVLQSRQSRKHLPENYFEVSANLDAYYILKKLKMVCELINRENILGKKAEINFLTEIRNIAMHQQFDDITLISIYRKILAILSHTDNVSAFDSLLKEVNKHKEVIGHTELSEIYQYIKNFCIRKINEGNPEYLNVLFDIYKDILDNEKLMRSEYLSQFEFKNIVSMGIRLNEKTWCRNFIEKYINYIKPEERSNVFKYNMSFWFFHAGEFRKAIKNLRDIEFTDVVYQIDSRVLLLKSYYELDEQDSFFYHASAFRLFILRNRHLSEYQKQINRNLIRYLSAIVRAGTSKAKLARIKNEIQQKKHVADISWLLEKVDAIL